MSSNTNTDRGKIFPVKTFEHFKFLMNMENRISNIRAANLIIHIGYFSDIDFDCLTRECGNEKFNLLIIAGTDTSIHQNLQRASESLFIDLQDDFPNLKNIIHYQYDLPDQTQEENEDRGAFQHILRLLNSPYCENKSDLVECDIPNIIRGVVLKNFFSLKPLPVEIYFLFKKCFEILQNGKNVCLINGYFFSANQGVFIKNNQESKYVNISFTDNLYYNRCIYMITFIEGLKNLSSETTGNFRYTWGDRECSEKPPELLENIKSASIYNENVSDMVLLSLIQSVSDDDMGPIIPSSDAGETKENNIQNNMSVPFSSSGETKENNSNVGGGLKKSSSKQKKYKNKSKKQKKTNKPNKPNKSTNKSNKSTKTKKLLPKLRKISKKKKKYHYRLKDTRKKRILAINEGVRYEMKYKNRSKKKAAVAKKARFNILRIYRKNKNKKACEKITSDMRYMDKKYKLGKTRNICREN